MKRTSLLAFALAIGISASAGAQTQVLETFDDDPAARGWAGVGNRTLPEGTGPQDYGFSTGDVTGIDVNPPGGTATGGGEFGGLLDRQNGTAAGGMDNFYGVSLNGDLDISDTAFSVSCVIHVYQVDGGSGWLIGYSRGVASYAGSDAGNAKNFIGIDFDDMFKSFPVMFSATGGRTRDGNSDPSTTDPVPDLPPFTTAPFSMAWDPNANGGSGRMSFNINGTAYDWNLSGGDKNDLDDLTHFGIMPVSADGAGGIVWIDDLKYTAFAAGIPGDVNNDGFVDIFDVNVVSANWGSPGGPTGDANGDGNVDIFDVNLISFNWAPPPAPGGAAAVPEPGSLTLAALALMSVVWMGRRSVSGLRGDFQ